MDLFNLYLQHSWLTMSSLSHQSILVTIHQSDPWCCLWTTWLQDCQMSQSFAGTPHNHVSWTTKKQHYDTFLSTQIQLHNFVRLWTSLTFTVGNKIPTPSTLSLTLDCTATLLWTTLPCILLTISGECGSSPETGPPGVLPEDLEQQWTAPWHSPWQPPWQPPWQHPARDGVHHHHHHHHLHQMDSIIIVSINKSISPPNLSHHSSKPVGTNIQNWQGTALNFI